MNDRTPDIKKGEKIVKELLNWLNIEENESTAKTPYRVAKYFVEAFKGLYETPPSVKLFESNSDYVCVTDIAFVSYCEHHLLPFIGKCGIVYFTKSNKIIGISKLARIVNYFASRPQVQERLTSDIADFLMNIEELNLEGCYIAISAQHLCMTIRGVKSVNAVTVTSAIRGDIDKSEAIHLLEINNFFKNNN